jgi:hypothetical protein
VEIRDCATAATVAVISSSRTSCQNLLQVPTNRVTDKIVVPRQQRLQRSNRRVKVPLGHGVLLVGKVISSLIRHAMATKSQQAIVELFVQDLRAGESTP